MGCNATKTASEPSSAPSSSEQRQLTSPLEVLSTLDGRLVVALMEGKIRLIRSAWLLQLPRGARISFRQELEALEKQGEVPTPLPGTIGSELPHVSPRLGSLLYLLGFLMMAASFLALGVWWAVEGAVE